MAELRRLYWRVLDPVTGAEVIHDLPHTHHATYTVMAAQPAQTGASSIGEFDIQLHAPTSSNWQKAFADYELLDYNQRVEGYVGAVGAGDPVFTGVLRELPKASNNWTLKGLDSVYLLEAATTWRNEVFQGTSDDLVRFALTQHSMVYGDDMSANTLSSYTADTTVSYSYSADENLPGFVGGHGTVWTPSSFPNADYRDCFVETYAHMTLATSPTGPTTNPTGLTSAAAGEAYVVVAADATMANAVFGGIVARYSRDTAGNDIWNIDAQIIRRISGVDTVVAVSQTVAVKINDPDLRVQIRMVGKQRDAGTYEWRLYVNGIDPECVFRPTDSSSTGNTPAGSIGMRSRTGSNFSQLWMFNRVNQFQEGAIATSSLPSTNKALNLMTMMDCMNLAMTTEGWIWRKNPKAGLAQDTIDFGPLADTGLGGFVGRDLSAMILFEEGVNLTAGQVDPNAEMLASEVLTSSNGSSDSGGLIAWRNKAAIEKYGLLSVQMDSDGVQNVLDARIVSKWYVDLKAKPGQAKSFTVLNDPGTVGLYREADFVSVTSPRIGLSAQKVQILSLKYQEGMGTTDLVCDQFSLHDPRLPQRKIIRILKDLAAQAPLSKYTFNTLTFSPYYFPPAPVPTITQLGVANVTLTVPGTASVLQTGQYADFFLPFNSTIDAIYLMADNPAGGYTVDIQAVNYGGWPGFATILSSMITTSSAKYTDSTLSGFTSTVFAAGTFFRLYVSANTSVAQLQFAMVFTSSS